MRNWNIRAELRRRAHMYDIENEIFHVPEIAIASSLPSVLMRSQSDKQYFNLSQRKASVTSKVKGRFKTCSVIERSRMIVSIQNLQSKRKLHKFGKTNRKYNSNDLKRLFNEKQYCPVKLISFPREFNKNSIEGESNETFIRIFYSNAIHYVSNNCERTNRSCGNCNDKNLKLNRNAIISNSSISGNFHSKSIYVKNKFEIKQNYEHTPPKLNSMNRYYSLL